jgi:hypothetical protein
LLNSPVSKMLNEPNRYSTFQESRFLITYRDMAETAGESVTLCYPFLSGIYIPISFRIEVIDGLSKYADV